MNFHNLIHVADDVLYTQRSLSAFSAFTFENLLGTIKKLIRSPNNPLAQVARRLHEMESINPIYLTKKSMFNECSKKADIVAAEYSSQCSNNSKHTLAEIKWM